MQMYFTVQENLKWTDMYSNLANANSHSISDVRKAHKEAKPRHTMKAIK